jgi:hypothetical protein
MRQFCRWLGSFQPLGIKQDVIGILVESELGSAAVLPNQWLRLIVERADQTARIRVLGP